MVDMNLEIEGNTQHTDKRKIKKRKLTSYRLKGRNERKISRKITETSKDEKTHQDVEQRWGNEGL